MQTEITPKSVFCVCKKHVQQTHFQNHQTITEVQTPNSDSPLNCKFKNHTKACSWPHEGPLVTANTHAEVQLPSVPPLSLPSEEHIIIIIIIDIIQRPTPVFQAKLKQSETVSMRFTEGSKEFSAS